MQETLSLVPDEREVAMEFIVSLKTQVGRLWVKRWDLRHTLG